MNKLKQNVGKEKQDALENGLEGSCPKLLIPNSRKTALSLFILLAITVLLAGQLSKLKFNYSFDSFFPEGDNELAYYDQFNREFGQFNDFLFVVLKSEELFSEDFRERVNSFKTRLSEFPETQSVVSPFDLQAVQINPLGVNTYNLIGNGKPPGNQELEALNLYGNFFGRDDRSIMLFLRHEEFTDKKLGDEFYLRILNLLKQEGFEDSIVSGKIQMQYDFTQKLENELGNLLIASLGIVVVILLVLFRSLKGLLLPLLILILTLIWTMGLMALVGKAIDVMVVMIPAILLIVSLSDVIHFIHKFDDYLRKGHTPRMAIAETVLTIGRATFLTSATTAIGFLGLLFLPIQPIREFGMLTAAGVILAFLITFLTLPSLLYIFPSVVERRVKIKTEWNGILNGFYSLISNNRKFALLGLGIVSLITIAGLPYLRLSTSLIVGLQKNEPELQKVAYFDKNFDGYKPFELGIELADDVSLLNESVLQKMQMIESYVETEYGVNHLQSPLNIVREINAGLNGGSRKHYAIPPADELEKIGRYYNSPRLKEARSQVQAKEGQLIRMIGRTKDLGSAYYHPKNDSLKLFLESLNGDGFEARLTGASYLIDKTDNYVVSSLMKGIGFALFAVAVFILIFFKSWKLAILTLLPNLLPIAILFGLMGWLGVDLNISTAIIFTVALGIAIDDSIHFIARYKLERVLHDRPTATKNAFTGTGKSIIVTSLVIILGFSVFLISGFSAAYYLGFFIVLAALVALLFDLILLPILLSRK